MRAVAAAIAAAVVAVAATGSVAAAQGDRRALEREREIVALMNRAITAAGGP